MKHNPSPKFFVDYLNNFLLTGDVNLKARLGDALGQIIIEPNEENEEEFSELAGICDFGAALHLVADLFSDWAGDWEKFDIRTEFSDARIQMVIEWV